MRWLKKHSPVHDSPSPEYPGLHVQLCDPLVLLHTASALQLRCPLAHSSTSENTLYEFVHDVADLNTSLDKM